MTEKPAITRDMWKNSNDMSVLFEGYIGFEKYLMVRGIGESIYVYKEDKNNPCSFNELQEKGTHVERSEVSNLFNIPQVLVEKVE